MNTIWSMILTGYGFIAMLFLMLFIIAIVSFRKELKGGDTGLWAIVCVAIVLCSAVWPVFLFYCFYREKNDPDTPTILEEVPENESESEVPDQLTLEMHEETFSGIRETGD